MAYHTPRATRSLFTNFNNHSFNFNGGLCNILSWAVSVIFFLCDFTAFSKFWHKQPFVISLLWGSALISHHMTVFVDSLVIHHVWIMQKGDVTPPKPHPVLSSVLIKCILCIMPTMNLGVIGWICRIPIFFLLYVDLSMYVLIVGSWGCAKNYQPVHPSYLFEHNLNHNCRTLYESFHTYVL